MTNSAPTPDLSHLPPLRDVIAFAQLDAKKSLGQNFLLDLNLTAKIVRAAGNLEGVNVIEVGPGPGGLTRPLVESAAASVTAIERDDRAVAALQPLVLAANGKLKLIPDDALKADYLALAPAPRAIVANLPYNIATPLLMGWLENITQFHSLTLMFQKEVADRLVAPPSTSSYGRLSVITQWVATAEKCLDLPPSAFTPPPKVNSSVVHLRPRPRTDEVAFKTMERITAAAFGQRRKMLRQSLKSLGVPAEPLLEQAGIAGTARAEEIDVAGFVRLAQALNAA